MSGICGILGSAARPIGPILQAMLERMRHRGPDGYHVSADEETGLGMGLAYMCAFTPDPAAAAAPFLERGGVAIAIDGGITNRREIAARCAPSGSSGNGSDAESALDAYRGLGADWLARLDGPFAAALWDRARRRVVLSRDKLGEKSLYYHVDAGRRSLVFASEIKAILAHPDVPATLDRTGLSLYLTFGYIPGPRTLFQGISKLLPGESLSFDLEQGARTERYWKLPRIADGVADEGECVRRLRELFLEGLGRYVNGAREVAVLLSGGVDSSIIVAGLKTLGVPRIATFTIGFPNRPRAARGCEDLRYARLVAKRFGTEHREVLVEAGHRPGRRLLRVVGQFDDLIMTPNSYSKYLLALAVREAGLNSVLTGSAAAGACGVHRKFLDAGKRARLLEKTRECRTDEERYYVLRGRLFDIEGQRSLLRDDPSTTREQVLEVLHHYIGGIRSDDFFRLFLFSNLMISSTEKSLKVLDKAGLLASVSLRSPYLDRGLVEYSTQLPSSFDGEKSFVSLKTHLKKAFENDLPRRVLDRAVVGYPSYYWNHGELSEYEDLVLNRETIESHGVFRYETVARLLEQDRASRAKSAGKWRWALTQFGLWYEIHVRRNPAYLEAA